MRTSEAEDFRELLAGTWIGVALIAEYFIQTGTADRFQVAGVLSQAEALAQHPRRIPLTAMRKLIERGFGGPGDAANDRGMPARRCRRAD